MTIPEMAERIGVSESRARFLVSSGRIRGQQVGARWVIDEANAADYRGAGAGRPLTERAAWLFVKAMQDPEHVAALDLTAVQRHRLRCLMARFHESSDPAGLVLTLLPRRADKALLSASPRDIDGLRQDSRLGLSGVSHPASGLLPAQSSRLTPHVLTFRGSSAAGSWYLPDLEPW